MKKLNGGNDYQRRSDIRKASKKAYGFFSDISHRQEGSPLTNLPLQRRDLALCLCETANGRLIVVKKARKFTFLSILRSFSITVDGRQEMNKNQTSFFDNWKSTHFSVNIHLPFALGSVQTDAPLLANIVPTLLGVTCCVRLHTLLHVVACCCAKSETSQTFEPTTPNISLFRDH